MIRGLGDRLRDLRTQRKLSQREVGELLGLTKGAIAAYERGINLPPVDILMKIASFYGTSTDYLLGIEKQEIISLSGLNENQRQILSQILGLALQLIEADKKTN